VGVSRGDLPTTLIREHASIQASVPRPDGLQGIESAVESIGSVSSQVLVPKDGKVVSHELTRDEVDARVAVVNQA